MPIYDFRNNETGEIFERNMSYQSKVEYLEQNPHIQSVILTAPPLGDPTKLTASRKFDSGFSEVLSRIHERTPGSQLNKISSQL
jgi:hypothetical protein